MKKPSKVRISATVIGLVLSLSGIILGFNTITQVFTRASDSAPREVLVSGIGQNSAKIVWSTGEESQAIVEYGTSPTALNFFAPESQRAKDHSVELSLLYPATTYYFQIKIGDQKFDNGGVPWTFSTKGGAGDVTADISPTSAPKTQTAAISPTKGANNGSIQRLSVSTDSTSVQTVNSANATVCKGNDCDAIKSKLGSGCSGSDYLRCLNTKLTPAP
jgi:hypothetical protein